MSETEEKSTTHNVIVRLLSEKPITYASAVFQLAKNIDSKKLEDNGLILMGYDFNDLGTHRKKERGPSKLGALAARSPGVLGDLFAFMKNYKWYQIYMGFAGAVLLGSLMLKWIIRAITGSF